MDMKEYVVASLRGYNDMVKEISVLEFELKNIWDIDSSELFSSLILPGQSGVATNSNRISNPTANVALSYGDTISKMKMESVGTVADRILILTQRKKRLDFYLDNLPAHYASVLRQHYIEGNSWTEIEALTGVAGRTLRSYREKGIELLVQGYQRIENLGVL